MDDREFPVNIGIACVRWIPKHCLRDIDIIQELSQLINPLNHCFIFKYNLFLNADFCDIDILDIVIQMSKSGLKIKKIRAFFFRSEKSFFFFLLLKHFYHRIVPYFVLFFRQRCLFDLEISAELGSLGGERQLSPDERTALLEVATLTKVKVRFSADASRVRSGSAAQDNLLLIETNTIKASGLE